MLTNSNVNFKTIDNDELLEINGGIATWIIVGGVLILAAGIYVGFKEKWHELDN